jgi:hypothetical protein
MGVSGGPVQQEPDAGCLPVRTWQLREKRPRIGPARWRQSATGGPVGTGIAPNRTRWASRPVTGTAAGSPPPCPSRAPGRS